MSDLEKDVTEMKSEIKDLRANIIAIQKALEPMGRAVELAKQELIEKKAKEHEHSDSKVSD